MPEANRRQADVPDGATVLPNRGGTAPGLWLEDERGRLAVLLPGVPAEMRGLLEQEVMPRLLERRAGARAPTHAGADAAASGAGAPTVIQSRTLRTTGIAESALADLVGDVSRIVGEHLTLAWLPGLDGTDLRLTAWGLPAARPRRRRWPGRPPPCGRCWATTATGRATPIWRRVVLDRAGAPQGATGGGGVVHRRPLGGRLTAIPGSSRVFLGGVVAYDNEVKLALLGVSADTLAAHGAVSEAVVRQMAAGVARSFGAETALAVTGDRRPGRRHRGQAGGHGVDRRHTGGAGARLPLRLSRRARGGAPPRRAGGARLLRRVLAGGD